MKLKFNMGLLFTEHTYHKSIETWMKIPSVLNSFLECVDFIGFTGPTKKLL